MMVIPIGRESLHDEKGFWRALFAFFYGRIFPKTRVAFTNVTMDEGESIIIHSPVSAARSVAVVVRHHKLFVFFNPPSTSTYGIEVGECGQLLSVTEDIGNQIVDKGN